MVRRYDDAVEVRGEGEPRQFLWRGRLYVVRDVLAHWYERSAWWDGASARAVRGDGADGAAGGTTRTGTRGAGGEREVWRVEASAGRSAGSGVYDLCASTPAPDRPPSWRLLRLSD